MKIDTGSVVAGILIHDELQRQSEDKQRRKSLEESLAHASVLAEQKKSAEKVLADQNILAEKKHKKLEGELSDAEDDFEDLRQRGVAWMNHANALQAEVENYRQLLRGSMREIASRNSDFKVTYDQQMELMADWIVSQKAFKELAIRYGALQGIGSEEVINIGMNLRTDVLGNKNVPTHRTNAEDSEVVRTRLEALVAKFAAQ